MTLIPALLQQLKNCVKCQLLVVQSLAVSDRCAAFSQVQDNSPGHQAGLEPFFDFIISVCDTRLVYSLQEDFPHILPGVVMGWNVSLEQGQRHLKSSVEHERGETREDAVIQRQDAGLQGDHRGAQQPVGRPGARRGQHSLLQLWRSKWKRLACLGEWSRKKKHEDCRRIEIFNDASSAYGPYLPLTFLWTHWSVLAKKRFNIHATALTGWPQPQLMGCLSLRVQWAIWPIDGARI